MCGVVGGFGPAAHRISERASELVSTLQHRGPDDSGVWVSDSGNLVLGHTRLAIRDVGQGASQPFVTRSGKSVLAYNGEIYNCDHISSILPKHFCPRTAGDTEVLAEALEGHGRDVLAQLEGMFAFAFASVDGRNLLLARDRMGEKPLYWFQQSDTVFFASELSPLRLLVRDANLIDDEVLCEYLTFGYISGGRSLLEGVNELRPSEWRQFHCAGPSCSGRYWQPSIVEDVRDHTSTVDAKVGLEPAIDCLEEHLLASVEAVLVSDRDMCLTLSGGIDSTLVCCAAARLGASLPAITVRAPSPEGSAEARLASWTAKRLGIDWEVIDVGPDSLASVWTTLRGVDQPLGDSSLLPTLQVCRAIRSSGAVVALGGDGGDELFLGYPHYLPRDQSPAVTKVSGVGLKALLPLTQRLPSGVRGRGWAMREGIGRADVLLRRTQSDWQTVGRLMGPGWSEASRSLVRERLSGPSDLPSTVTLNAFDLAHYLPGDILRKTDRSAMSVGLELRSPWLHPRVVDFGLGLPASLRLLHGLKTLPRLLLSRWLPDNPLSSQPKRGFSIPLGGWLRTPAGLDSFSEMLRHLPPNVDSGYVSTLLKGQARGRTNESRLFSLAALAAWHSQADSSYHG